MSLPTTLYPGDRVWLAELCTGLSNWNVFSALDVTKVSALRQKRQIAVVADGAKFIARGLWHY